jgi:hypothetical protein
MAYDGWGPVPMTPTQEVAFLKKWLAGEQVLLDHLKETNATHIRLRRTGKTLTIDAYHLHDDKPLIHANHSGFEGYWFTFGAMGVVTHSFPPKYLTKSRLTAIAHPFS